MDFFSIRFVCRLFFLICNHFALNAIPVVGYLDDAAVLALCLKFAKHDVDEYKQVMGSS